MELLLRIVGIITPVLLVGAVGYAYGRRVRPNMAAVNRLSTDVLFPALIFSSMAAKDFVIAEQGPLLAAGTLMMLGSGVVGWGAARVLGYNVHAFVPSMMFTNTANMGLPLTLFAFGPELLPPAVMNYILADRYGQDPGLVSAIVVGGNLASLAFVPLALYLGL